MPANDTYFGSVALLLPMDDFALSDAKGRTVSKYGTVRPSSVQKKWGKYSARLDTGGYLQVAASADWFFGTGAFTIECWVYIAGNSATDGSGIRNAQLWTNMSGSAGGFGFQIVGNGSTTGTGLGWEDKYGGSNIGASWTTTVTQNEWHHVAVCRANGGSDLYLCLDGTVQTSAITGGSSRSLGSSAYAAQIGGQPAVSGWNRYLNGYIDDFRITLGVARYTANYTPPAAALPPYGRFVGGTLTEATDHTEFRVRSHRLDTGALLNETVATGAAYEVPCSPSSVDYTGPVIITAHPRMGGAWAASTIKALGDYCIPTNPVATPYVFKASAVDIVTADSSKCVLLAHLNGTDNSTTGFVDETGKTITPSGNVKHEDTQKKFGDTSAYFDGTGDYLSWAASDDFRFQGDFTMECFFYPTSTRAHTIMDQRSAASSTGLVVATDSSNKVGVYYNGAWRIQQGAGLSNNAWYHIALVRESGGLTLYIDGAAVNTYSTATELTDGYFRVGCDFQAGQGLLGYVDEIRVLNGVAAYTDNFTPPASAFASVCKTGSSEPTWPTTPGDTVDDGEIRWQCVGRMIKPVTVGPLIPSL